jgi:phosphosulfolactate synthase (CoM biosynthesis protein A)
MGPDVDGIKLAGGSGLAMQRQAVVDLIDIAHEHGAYAACAGSLEYVLQKVLDGCPYQSYARLLI